MRAIIIATLMLALGFIAAVGAAEPVLFEKSQLIGGEIPTRYRPNYPMEARGRHQSGSGIFILHVDPKTGKVGSVTVKKSTGYKLLDDAAVTACTHWPFKPNTVTDVRLPVTFSMRGAVIQEWGPHGAGD
jgi:TonB family protein